MQTAGLSYFNNLKNDLDGILANKKNLIIYEGSMDGLEENISLKYFYSSPYDPLEFITVDIFYDTQKINLNNMKIKASGVISLITDNSSICNTFYKCEYGFISIENINIRGIEKKLVKLYINVTSIRYMKSVIQYFEEHLSNKYPPA